MPSKTEEKKTQKRVYKKKTGGTNTNNTRTCPISLSHISTIPADKLFYVDECKNIYHVDDLGDWVFYYGHDEFPHNRVKLSVSQLNEVWMRYVRKDNARYVIQGATIRPKRNAIQSIRQNARLNAEFRNDSLINMDSVMWDVICQMIPGLATFVNFWSRRRI